ncbi:hypothetical protein QBC46DRAFT_351409 [Diplogelasinospora grovesii]|uniref:Uncharacterized protein n=1 Tax=Diplogelasinospora grovesii TaxID=303347 RepID=A0AAN6NDM2_9PEZI|nr:hypothetical protein QBC46DRAFT_351409 [Diplogelasinospora grovesii]
MARIPILGIDVRAPTGAAPFNYGPRTRRSGKLVFLWMATLFGLLYIIWYLQHNHPEATDRYRTEMLGHKGGFGDGNAPIRDNGRAPGDGSGMEGEHDGSAKRRRAAGYGERDIHVKIPGWN